MDVNTHVRAVWRHRWLVLAGAALLGLLVLTLRLSAEPTSTSTATLVLVPGVDSSDSEVERLTTVYAQFGDNVALLTGTNARLPAFPTAVVRRSTSVVSPSDGLFTVTATATTPEASAALANAYAAAFIAAVAGDQQRSRGLLLAPLDTQIAAVERQLAALPLDEPRRADVEDRRAALLDARAEELARSSPRVDALSTAEPRDAVTAPRAVRDALLAFLVGLILVSELVVLRAVRQGRLDGIGVAEALEALTGLPVLRIAGSSRGDDQRAAVLSLVLAGAEQGRPVLLKALPLDPTPAAHRGWALLAEAAELGGRRAVLVDADSSTDAVAGGPVGVVLRPAAAALAAQAAAGHLEGTGSAALVLVHLRSWDVPQLLPVAALPGTTALVVDARSVTRAGVEEALRVLRLAGSPAEMVLLVDLSARDARASRPVRPSGVARTTRQAPKPVAGRTGPARPPGATRPVRR